MATEEKIKQAAKKYVGKKRRLKNSEFADERDWVNYDENCFIAGANFGMEIGMKEDEIKRLARDPKFNEGVFRLKLDESVEQSFISGYQKGIKKAISEVEKIFLDVDWENMDWIVDDLIKLIKEKLS